jgi:hypothetical protein
MKNNFCDLSESQINGLPIPDEVKGILLSPFQHNRMGGFVHVPEETFKEMIDAITRFIEALQKIATPYSNGIVTNEDAMVIALDALDPPNAQITGPKAPV